MKDHLPGLLHVAAALAVALLSLFTREQMPLRVEIYMPAGLMVTLAGMLIVLSAAAYLKQSFKGHVAPAGDVLIVTGPYRFVRHPTYFGMTIALAGISMAYASWTGLAAVLVLFLPSAVYRARCEDRALSQRFGSGWDAYAARTGFLFPRLRNR